MRILPAKPHSLFGRDAPNASPIECQCGEHFLWERGRGDKVTCPTCKVAETLDFSGRPAVTMTKDEAAGAEVSGPPPAAPAGHD